jgi:uncharacterized integral membrane protein
MSTTPERRSTASSLLRNRRAIAGVLIAALVTLFAVLNFDEVEVNWILGTWETPLIVVIAVTFLLGLGAGWSVGASRRRNR